MSVQDSTPEDVGSPRGSREHESVPDAGTFPLVVEHPEGGMSADDAQRTYLERETPEVILTRLIHAEKGEEKSESRKNDLHRVVPGNVLNDAESGTKAANTQTVSDSEQCGSVGEKTDEQSQVPERRRHWAPVPVIYRVAPPPKPPRMLVHCVDGVNIDANSSISVSGLPLSDPSADIAHAHLPESKGKHHEHSPPDTPASTGFVSTEADENVELLWGPSDPPVSPHFVEIPLNECSVPECDITDMRRDISAPREESVVRLDLSDLTTEESDKIMHVMGQDSIFRAEEKGRIDKIEAELHEESQRRQTAAQRNRDARRACQRCGTLFRFLFNKRLVCRICGAGVCRKCATFEEGRAAWVCTACQRERELQASKWLSEIQLRHRITLRAAIDGRVSESEDDSGYDPSVSLSRDGSIRHKPPAVSPPEEPVSITSEVRGHLESVVETLLGESIQVARVTPAPADAALHKSFHLKLVTAISRLTQSLCMTLQNQPLEEPLTPTSTLAELKALLQQAQRAAMQLPAAQQTGGCGPPLAATEECGETLNSLTSAGSAEAYPEEPNSHTYEEILATAVLSQLAEKARRAAAAHDGTAYCDAGVQSEHAATGGEDVAASSDDGDAESQTSGVLEIMIEEEIEEILAYESGADGSDAAEGSTLRRSSLLSQSSTTATHSSATHSTHDRDDSVVLPGPSLSYTDLDFDGVKSVPFPEMGTSLPDSSSITESGELEDLGGNSWEDNWYFKRRRLTQNNRLVGEDPVPMLVPDPSDPTRAVTTVGSRDVDELSDLSERGSFDSEEEPWRSVSPLGDVTERLRAASHADRHRYRAARRDSQHGHLLGEPADPRPLAPCHRNGSNSSDTVCSGSSLPSDSVSAPEPAPPTEHEPAAGVELEDLHQQPLSEAELIYRKHCALKAAAAAAAAVGAGAQTGVLETPPRKSPKVERRIAQMEQRTQSLTAASHVAEVTPTSSQELLSAENSSSAGAHKSAASSDLSSGSVDSTAGKTSSSGTKLKMNGRTAGTKVRPSGPSSEVVTQAGQIVQLRCRLPSDGAAEIHWLRGDAALERSARVETYVQRHQACLQLHESHRRDGGRYSCRVVTRAGDETWQHFNLRVISSGRTPQHPSIPLPPDYHQEAPAGGTLRLLVRAAGFPEPRVTFLRGERTISRAENTCIERHSGGEWVLSIHPVSADDAGHYQVQATSSQGRAQAQFCVRVTPAPSTPQRTTAAAAQPRPLSPDRLRPTRAARRLSPPTTSSAASLFSQVRLRPVASRSPVTAPVAPSPAGVTSPPAGVMSSSAGVTSSPAGVTSSPAGVTPPPAGVTSSPVGVTSSPAGVTSPTSPEIVTSREEALKETSLITEACNSVIVRAAPARVRGTADGGGDSDIDDDDDDDDDRAEICLPQLQSGSIAEREYRKWANAVEMPNNPYTRESVRQRRSSLVRDRTGYYPHISSSADDVSDQEGRSLTASSDSTNKIYCGLKSIDSAMYRRDYYVNAGGAASDAPPAGYGSLPLRRGKVSSSSRPVSVMSEEPLPPLSEHASTDDLPATVAGAAGASLGSVYHSAESLAVAAPADDRHTPAVENGHQERVGSADSAELPAEGTVRSAVQKMNTLSRSSEHLAHSPVMNGRQSSASVRQAASPGAGAALTPPPPAPPAPPATEPDANTNGSAEGPLQNGVGGDRATPLYVDVHAEQPDDLEPRASPDGRESLASSGSSTADVPPQLPSVKQLRSCFQSDHSQQLTNGSGSPAKQPLSPLLHANVLIIDKSDPEIWDRDEPKELRKVEKLRKKMSNHKVHSLTARSVSREFREGLKLGAPLSLQSNIRDPSLVSQQRASAASSLPPVIDERCEIVDRDGDHDQHAPPTAKLVAARTAFWDSKVAQEMV